MVFTLKRIGKGTFLYEEERRGQRVITKYHGNIQSIVKWLKKTNFYKYKSTKSSLGQRLTFGDELIEEVRLVRGALAAMQNPLAPSKQACENGRVNELRFDDIEGFRKWTLSYRNLSERTAKTYVRYLEKEKIISPGELLESKLKSWRWKALRVYVHYLDYMGKMGAEESHRWLTILKFKQNRQTGIVEVSPQDVQKIINYDGLYEDQRSLAEICYYSGCRIVEGAYLLTNEVEHEDFEGFRRYHIEWTRGKKHCSYIYLPSFIEVKRYPSVDPELFARQFWKAKLPKPKLLRKFFYRVARQTAFEGKVDPAVADFIQGRVSGFSVGERHYGDLRAVADQVYPAIAARLKASLQSP